jgi:hypothetical protein
MLDQLLDLTPLDFIEKRRNVIPGRERGCAHQFMYVDPYSDLRILYWCCFPENHPGPHGWIDQYIRNKLFLEETKVACEDAPI